MSEYVNSVAKAARILYVFDQQTRVLTVRDIAARTGIPRSTVHETIRTLVANGLLENCQDGGVRLGAGLAMLGGQVVERQGLVDRALQPIKRNLDTFGVEVHVAGYVPGSVYYAHRQIARSRMAVTNRTGRRWPIYASACGRAILATMSETQRHSQVPQEFGIGELRKLDAEASRFEEKGYLVTDVSERGIISVAAPVYDSSGAVIGAIGCGEARENLTPQRIDQLGVAVRTAAQETSRLLWAPPQFTGSE